MRKIFAALGLMLAGVSASGTATEMSRGDQAVDMLQRMIMAPSLAPFEGDWVLQRVTRLSPLAIMGISTDTNKMVRVWRFDYNNLDRRLGTENPRFYVYGDTIELEQDFDAKQYVMSPDKSKLTCSNCSSPEVWVKSDPNKDLSDRDYARKMAGNPH